MIRKKKEIVSSVLMSLPALLLFALLIIYPVCNTIYLSLTKWKGISGIAKEFVGFDNYTKVLANDSFWNALLNSGFFMIGGFLILMPLAFALAIIVTSKLKFTRFFKVAYFMPVMLSTTAVALIWVYILNPGWGAVNQLLTALGLGAWCKDWLATPVVNVWSVVLVNEWMYAGYNMLIFAAGLITIPDTLYDAAKIDGCSSWKSLWHITLPLSKESFKIFSVLCITGCLKVFDLIWAMTKGGPNNVSSTPAILLYTEAFTYKDFGKSSVIGTLLLIMGIILSLLVSRAMRSEELS
ncbi:MAG: sugar ABC transporter permease [Clostridiaceae bacterium]|nr:sugar ABC transporter permease [Clostridiaceae bacterium]